MEKIKLSDITYPNKSSLLAQDKYFWIWLGTGSRFCFSSKRGAEDFLRKTNKFLNEKAFELNDILISVYVFYRQNWFNIETISFMGVGNKIDTNFQMINKAFNWMFTHNWHHDVVINQFINIINYLNGIVFEMKVLHKQANRWQELRQLNLFIERLNKFEKELRDYGKNIPNYSQKQGFRFPPNY